MKVMPYTAPPMQTQATKSAEGFEAMFLGQMVDEMLSTVKLGEAGGGFAADQWRSFLSDAIGQRLAEGGGTGIARSIEGAIARYETGQGT